MKNLHIYERETEGIVILDLKGPVVLGDQDASLRNIFRALLQGGRTRIVLNLKDAGKIDSTGLGTLVFALENMQSAGGGLALYNLNASHLDLLVLTKLHVAFGIFADEHDAVSSYFPGRATKFYDILEFVRRQSEAGDAGVRGAALFLSHAIPGGHVTAGGY